MNTKLISGVLAVVATCLSTSAFAGWYVGARGGASVVEDTGGTLTRQLRDQGERSAVIDIDSTDVAGNVYIGYEWGNYLGIELGGFTLGEHDAQVTGTTSDASALPGRVAFVQPRTAEGISLTTNVRVPLSPRWEGRLKLGLAFWDFEADIVTSNGTFRLEDDGTDPTAGIGLWYGLSRQIAIGVDIDLYNLNDDGVIAFTGGLEWHPSF